MQICEPAALDYIEMRRVEAEIGIEIDVDVERRARSKMRAIWPGDSLSMRGAPTTTSTPSFSAWIITTSQQRLVRLAFLRKNAQFEIDRLCVVLLQSLQRAKAGQPDARIDLSTRVRIRVVPCRLRAVRR